MLHEDETLSQWPSGGTVILSVVSEESSFALYTTRSFGSRLIYESFVKLAVMRCQFLFMFPIG
jgi:hypothetical protein